MTQSSASLALVPEPVWFCLKTQPKREHLAATALRRQFGVECFSPRLRFRKMTQRGPVWFVEAMFPGYLFAKFIYSTQHRAVESSHGISGIVHFGDRLAILPENIVTALQSSVGSEEIVTLDCSIKVGQSVEIVDGPFQGLKSLLLIYFQRESGSASFSIFLGGPWKWNFRQQKCSQHKADCARYFSPAISPVILPTISNSTVLCH